MLNEIIFTGLLMKSVEKECNKKHKAACILVIFPLLCRAEVWNVGEKVGKSIAFRLEMNLHNCFELSEFL